MREQRIPKPVLVVGVPRSGTSMVTKCLAQLGLWVGPTRHGDGLNRDGYWENDQLTGCAYSAIGTQLLGSQFTDKDFEPRKPTPAEAIAFRTAFLQCAKNLGYKGGPLVYKDPVTVLHWRLWHAAFPRARWLVCDRDERGCLKSLMNFYKAGSPACRAFRERFTRRIDEILHTPETDCFRLSTDLMVRGTGNYFETACSWMGISRRGSVDTLRANIKPQLWHHKERPC